MELDTKGRLTNGVNVMLGQSSISVKVAETDALLHEQALSLVFENNLHTIKNRGILRILRRVEFNP